MSRRNEENDSLYEQRAAETERRVSGGETSEQESSRGEKVAAFFGKLWGGIKHYASLIILVVFVGAVALVANLLSVDKGTNPMMLNAPEAEAAYNTGGSKIESAAALKQFLRVNTGFEGNFLASNYSSANEGVWNYSNSITWLDDATRNEQLNGTGSWLANNSNAGFIYDDAGGVRNYAFWAPSSGQYNWLIMWPGNGGGNKWLNYVKFRMRSQGEAPSGIDYYIDAKDSSGNTINLSGSASSPKSVTTSWADYGVSIPLRNYQYIGIHARAKNSGESGWLLIQKIETSYYHDRSHYLTTNIQINYCQ